jgi:3-deoxy-D-arabino-heptulosonate 7-phosphate (DAHP) synthase
MTTETPMKIIVDLSKPKGERESIIPLTKAEIAEREAQAVIAEAERVEQEAIAEQKAIDAQAGLDALVALGLTEAQISALLGK